MNYYIEESTKNIIHSYNKDIIEIKIENLNILINNDKEITLFFLNQNEIINYINPSQRLKDAIMDYIINDKSEKYLESVIAEERLPLFSMLINVAKKTKKDYRRLQEIANAENIVIKCNKEKFTKALELAKKYHTNVIIDATNISLVEYKEIFDNYNIEELNNLNIKINYQEQNTPLTLTELYKLSIKVDNIINNIKKYNLSQLEQVMYIYDIIKEREYKESENNLFASRDIDKVIDGDYIVCSGYSNLFNSILKCLNIKAMPVLDYQKMHQRSIAYIKDPKYNIDGVYAFDLTLDRKLNKNDQNYIDRYNGFMIPYFKSHYDHYDNRFKAFEIDIDDIIEKIKYEGSLIKTQELEESLNIICSFIKEEKEEYEECDLYKKIKSNFKKSKVKYSKKELDIDTFLQVLYNTRRIEYVTEIVNTLSKEELIKTVFRKYNNIYKKEILKSNKDSVTTILNIMRYENQLEGYLNNKFNEIVSQKAPNEFERDKENITLIRVLKKINK